MAAAQIARTSRWRLQRLRDRRQKRAHGPLIDGRKVTHRYKHRVRAALARGQGVDLGRSIMHNVR